MDNYKLASRGASVGIFVYLILACVKLLTGYFFKASSLYADGLNNLSDIIASVAIWMGLYIARKPADRNHQFGHDRYEIISSFIVAMLMFSIGIQVISSSLHQLFTGHYSQTSPQVFLATLFSITTLYFTKKYINQLATRSRSLGLKATAKDMQGDLLISLTTLVGNVAVKFGLPILDTILAVIVGGVIIISAYDIFKESSFTLSDGFDPDILQDYQQCILTHSEVQAVHSIRARLVGQHVYLDVAIGLEPDLTVFKSHQITEEVESLLITHYQIKDVDIHVEPILNNLPNKKGPIDK